MHLVNSQQFESNDDKDANKVGLVDAMAKAKETGKGNGKGKGTAKEAQLDKQVKDCYVRGKKEHFA